MSNKAGTRLIPAGLILFSGLSLANGPDPDETFSFDGPVFDIAATPSGSILVADFDTVREIRANGVRDVATLPVVFDQGAFEQIEPTFINGLQALDNGSFYASRSALDLAVGGALFRVRPGAARSSRNCIYRAMLGESCPAEERTMLADIEDFTLGNWPVNAPGQNPGWKNWACEPPGGYTAGPQSNPYHIRAVSENDVLIADAAANSLLRVRDDGVEVVATFDPVADPDTGEPLVQFPLDDETNCPVEPVPTSVDVGPDGAVYVGELNGTTGNNFIGEPTPSGLASIWRLEPGMSNLECPSDGCVKVVTGLNSVIDIEFGPDGMLYVVEYEQNGFLATVAPDFGIPLAGGRVKRCDVTSDECETIAGEDGSLLLPGAITFDKDDNLWLLENVFAPTVRRIEW
ncbi:MAG: ScyD/ScyE family protein [Candidatus Wenzhouxiangella sp. M2_3B_020]